MNLKWWASLDMCWFLHSLILLLRPAQNISVGKGVEKKMTCQIPDHPYITLWLEVQCICQHKTECNSYFSFNAAWVMDSFSLICLTCLLIQLLELCSLLQMKAWNFNMTSSHICCKIIRNLCQILPYALAYSLGVYS